MGVRNYYILCSESRWYLGPKAYYELVRRFKRIQAYNPLMTMEKLNLPKGGWRKRIRILYEFLRGTGEPVELRCLKTRNPRKDGYYREVAGLL